MLSSHPIRISLGALASNNGFPQQQLPSHVSMYSISSEGITAIESLPWLFPESSNYPNQDFSLLIFAWIALLCSKGSEINAFPLCPTITLRGNLPLISLGDSIICGIGPGASKLNKRSDDVGLRPWSLVASLVVRGPCKRNPLNGRHCRRC